MLTAKLKNGQTLCLAHGYSREALKQLRDDEEFLCPSCGEQVILKLGTKRIFHFSHLKDGCEESKYDRESEYHLAGKLALFNWLRRQGIPAAVEQYDPYIRQRPDITFLHQNRHYALEFQCSTIPEECFIKRTQGYESRGYIPLWILGATHLPKYSGKTVQLSGFHYLFYRDALNGPGFIPFFCPDTGRFTLLHSISPYSTSKAFASKAQIHLNRARLRDALIPPSLQQVPGSLWRRKLVQSKLLIGANPATIHTKFLNDLYTAGKNLFLLPPQIGQPGFFSVSVTAFPIIWQTYLFIDLLFKKTPGSFVTVEEIVQSLEKRCARGDIRLRVLPLAKDMTLGALAYEYLSRLAALGFLVHKQDGVFLLQKEMLFPGSTAEQMAMEDEFYRRNT
ncbi:competence protein CoiA [Bacillus sp. EB01]|uniref:competence protein CoiA n=1 Tax=Bacillus sp. EB01 TaxID=1347086 RepID=UPI0006936F05|nr:competence protein CoiA family protein [Bacillus sp. EB01]